MVATTSHTPLRGRYLVRNRKANLVLYCIDAFLSFFVKSKKVPFLIPKPKRILLCDIAHLGDIVIATSILPIIKSAFPNAEIGFLIGNWSKSILGNHPSVNWLHTLDHWKINRAKISKLKRLIHYLKTRRQALKEIKALRYDVAIDLYYYFPNSIPLLWQAKIPVRIGYISAGFGPLLTHPFEWKNQDIHISKYQAHLLKALSLESKHFQKQKITLDLSCVPERDKNSPLLQSPYIIIHLGVGLAIRQWPLEKWRLLTQRLVKKGYNIIFTGNGETEKQNVNRTIYGLKDCYDFCEKTDWNGFLSIIQNAKLVIGLESLASHLATTFCIPCIAIYTGMNNINHWRPLGESCKVLIHDVPCTPCYISRGCYGMECIQNVSVEEVYQLAIEMLNNTKKIHHV